MIASFLASLRLSVFWRRRRDILNQNFEEVVRILELCLCTEEDLLFAEKCILQHTGCLVWVGNTNIVEAVYVILGILSVKGEPLSYLKNTSVDICYILLAGIIHTSQHSTWYGISHIHIDDTFRESALAAVVVSVGLLCQAEDLRRICDAVIEKRLPCDKDRINSSSQQILNFIINF